MGVINSVIIGRAAPCGKFLPSGRILPVLGRLDGLLGVAGIITKITMDHSLIPSFPTFSTTVRFTGKILGIFSPI